MELTLVDFDALEELQIISDSTETVPRTSAAGILYEHCMYMAK